MFSKKLIVFRSMSDLSSQPKSFTRSDKFICVTGLLLSLPIDSSESEIRNEICEVIKSASEFKDVSPDDFEFINRNGKQATVPQCKEGFKWDGRSVKELAGSGSIYVRLLRNIELEGSGTDEEKSSGSEDLPYVNVSTKQPSKSWTQESSTNLYSISSVPFSNDVDSAGPSGTSDLNLSSEMTSMLSVTDDCSLEGATASSAIYIEENDDNDVSKEVGDVKGISPVQDFTKLQEIFTSLNDKQLKYTYDVSRKSISYAIETLIDGPSMISLLCAFL